jgi:para-aminobenzoate synthetase component 1
MSSQTLTVNNQTVIMAQPLVRKFNSEILPVEVYQQLKNLPFSFFLDSGMNPQGLGKYSFIGFDPFMTMESKGNQILLTSKDGKESFNGDPWQTLKALLGRYSIPRLTGLPPLLGGCVGYFAYDLGAHLEVLPSLAIDDLAIPDCIQGFYDTVLIYDHEEKLWLISSTGLPEADTARRKEYAELRMIAAAKLLDKKDQSLEQPLKEHLAEQPPELASGKAAQLPDASADLDGFLKTHFTPIEYCQGVQAVKDYIAAGDVFQVNLTQRFDAPLPTEPFELYKVLRTINPAPFAGYLNYPEVVIASASPERYLLVNHSRVETRPIKGTRPRGQNPAADQANREELLNSSKDRAELVMIIDLMRNDLGRVCTTGTVRVPDLIRLEEYPTVFHLVSTVEGQLPADKSIIDVLQASFPGSITGAPKIRAMEIIEELEPVKRGIYTGSMGYIAFSGDADLNIVIRTLVIKDGWAYFHVGGGIVTDSDPQLEYEETLHKGRALRTAIDLCRKCPK